MDRFEELLMEYLDGSLAPEQERELAEMLQQDEEKKRGFLELYRQGWLMAVELGGASEEEFVRKVLSEIREDERSFVKNVAKDIRNGRLEPAVETRPEGKRLRGLFPVVWRALAVAAGVLAMVGGYFLFTQTGPSGVDKLIARARTIRTVAELKALNGPAQEAYQRELAQGDECNLVRLVNLGLATAITGNPREDRQAQDLGFVLEQAAKAGAEWQVAQTGSSWGFSLIPVAEAAVDLSRGMTATEHRGFREIYAKARELARDLYYDQYLQTLETATANLSADSLLRQSAGFEGGYVYLYERDFARMGLTYADGHIARSPYREYYLQRLRPSLAARAKREQELEDNLDLRNQAAWKTFGNGHWTLSETNGCLVIAQTNKDAKGAFLYLGGKSFQEAVFTGLVRVGEVGDELNGWLGLGAHFANDHYTGLHDRQTDFSRRKWTVFRLRLSHRGGHCWFIRSEVRLEGGECYSQPNVGGDDKPYFWDRGRVALRIARVSAEWRNLQLEVIRP